MNPRLRAHSALRPLFNLIAAWFVAVPCFAQASATVAGDVTGMWFDASRPGWGISLAEQNDVTFATLFIYDSNGVPAWYVASRLEPRVPSVNDCGVTALEGPLYRTQWPNFAAGVDPHGNLQVTAVGTMTFYVVTDPGCDLSKGAVLYAIDGVSRLVDVTRQTWLSNQARLHGLFTAGLAFPSTIGISPPPPCPDMNASLLPVSGRQLVINGTADLSADDARGVLLTWGTGVDTVCQVRGAYAQGGQLGLVTGTLSCGPVGSATTVGPIRLANLYVTDAGFVADVLLEANACHYRGTLSGARRP